MPAPSTGLTNTNITTTDINTYTTAGTGSLVNTDHPHYIYLVLAFGMLSGCVLCGILLWIKNKWPKWFHNHTNNTSNATNLANKLSETQQTQQIIAADSDDSTTASKHEDEDEEVLEEILEEVEEMKSLSNTNHQQSIQSPESDTMKTETIKVPLSPTITMNNLDTPALIAQQVEGNNIRLSSRISKMINLSDINKQKSGTFEVMSSMSEGRHKTPGICNEEIDTEWPIVPTVPESMLVDRFLSNATAQSSSSLYGSYKPGLINDDKETVTPTTRSPEYGSVSHANVSQRNLVIVTNAGDDDDDDENVPAPPAPPNMNEEDEKEVSDDDMEEDDSSSFDMAVQAQKTISVNDKIALSNSKLLTILPMSASNDKRASDLFKFDAVDTFANLNKQHDD